MTDDELAQLRADERARLRQESDKNFARYFEAERRADRGICAFCRRRWFWGQAVMNRPKLPRWIPEARVYAHDICAQREREKETR